jgi:hypothetical protein
MFGDDNNDNSKALLLPIVYDMANLIREGVVNSKKVKKRQNNSKHNLITKRVGSNYQPKDAVTKEVDFASPISYYNSDVLKIEESGPVIKDIQSNETSSFEFLKDTNHTKIDLKLSNKKPPLNTTKAQSDLTMEQIEHMALSELNGTLLEDFNDTNGTDASPMALTLRRRVKPNQKFRGPFIETCERFTGEMCKIKKKFTCFMFKIILRWSVLIR